MDITMRTTVREALPFLKEEHFKELLDKCDPIPLKKPVIGMTVGEFIQALDDDYWNTFFDDLDEYLVVAIGRVKKFQSEMEDINKVLRLNEVKQSSEETAAAKGVIWPTFQENMLCDCVEYFNLHSIDEAENIPLSNYLIMKRKKSAEALFERNLNRIYTEKSKKKTK